MPGRQPRPGRCAAPASADALDIDDLVQLVERGGRVPVPTARDGFLTFDELLERQDLAELAPLFP